MILSDIVGKLISKAPEILDELVTTKEEKQAFYLELEQLSARDREDARSMYKDDSSLQRIYAMVFLVSYILLLVGMLALIYTVAINSGVVAEYSLPDWAQMFLSSVFGAMTAKVGTITDFLFGASKSSPTKK